MSNSVRNLQGEALDYKELIYGTFGQNLERGLPTNVVQNPQVIVDGITSNMDNMATKLLNISSDVVDHTTDVALSAVSAVTNGVYNITESVSNGVTVISELINNALADVVSQVETEVTKALKEMLKLPSIGDITGMCGEYYGQYYMPVVTKELLINYVLTEEERAQIQETKKKAKKIKEFINSVFEKIEVFKKNVQEFINNFKKRIEDIQKNIERGIQWVKQQIQFATNMILDAVHEFLWGKDPNDVEACKIKKKNMIDAECDGRIKKYEAKIPEMEAKYAETKLPEYDKKIKILKSKIERERGRKNNAAEKLDELQKFKTDFDLLDAKIDSVKSDIGNCTTIDEISACVDKLIGYQFTKEKTNTGIVGFIVSEKNRMIRGMGNKIACALAQKTQALAKRVLKLALAKADALIAKVKAKVISLVAQALLALMTLLGL